jgi:hypothetical protein
MYDMMNYDTNLSVNKILAPIKRLTYNQKF